MIEFFESWCTLESLGTWCKKLEKANFTIYSISGNNCNNLRVLCFGATGHVRAFR